MGTGNYSHPDGETVILDLYDDIDEQAVDDGLSLDLAREAFRDMQMEIETILRPTAFFMDGESWRRDHRDCLVLAGNALYQIWSHEDSYGHVFLTYGLREDIDPSLEGMARARLAERAEAFFDRLEEIYPLRVATSPWTSARRRPGSLAGAA